jgi:glycosyltransferase involved in cell wall biosynthesis
MKVKINKLIKIFFSRLGYNLIEKKVSGEIITNVFRTSYLKTALLSYVKTVFENPENKNDLRHTNRYTTFLMAKVLSKLEYNVDVIDCGDEFNNDFSKYSLVIGLGKSLDYVLENRINSKKTKVIWFGTGCNPLFSNIITLNRVDDFYKRTSKLLLSSSRYIKQDWPLQHEFADWIILHGSDFAKQTYKSKNIRLVNAPVFINHSIKRSDKEWNLARKNYLWFGVGGLIHKGLDLLIESFKDIKDCNLHICGNLEVEPDFYNYYKQVIDLSENINYHGFVDVSSEKFKTILSINAFVIFPSASEGNSPSVITCMANGGLIPIVSKNADVKLNGYGIIIEDLSIEEVSNAISKSKELTLDELKGQSEKIVKETNHLNSFDYFEHDFKIKLEEALKII